MELNTNYNTAYMHDFICSDAATKEKPIIFIRSWGWNNTTDVSAINASMDLYKSILPLDIWTSMHVSEFTFIEAEDLTLAVDWCDDVFPKSQESTTNQANYVFYAVYNTVGQLVSSNE